MKTGPTFDVAVVGGGTAGVAAALSAAALGARTLLCERADVLGGNAAQAFVHTICGLYLPAANGPPLCAHAGFPRRFAEALRRTGAALPPERAGRVHVLPTDPDGLASLAAELCARAAGLEVWMRHELVEAELAGDGRGESGLAVRDPRSTTRALRARVVVDASGDGAVAALGGAEVEMEPPARLQRPSFIFRLGGVDGEALGGFGRLRLSHAVAGAARTGALPAGVESILVRRAIRPGEAHVTLNVPPLEGRPFAPLDPAYREALEKRARAGAEAIVAFLRETRPAFAQAQVVAWPRRIGIRETRRIRGRARLEAQDVLGGRRRDDEVALSTWPIELWHDHRRAVLEYPQGPCSIPLGALVSRSHPRLGAAGRCLSASHEAHGALRVIGTALATGEAIGVAAALAADADAAPGDVPPARVRAAIEALAGEPAA